jgi:acyl carrier protein
MLATQERVADIGRDVMQEIFRLLAPYQVGGKGITPQTVISTGLTVDSLTIMDVIMELEDRFDVTIPLNTVAEIDTIDQLADTVLRLRAARL